MPPVLVFLHGWALDASLWDGLAARLGGYRREIVDFGYFGAPVSPPILGADREAGAPVIAREAGAPVIAVGHSFGALWFLHERPFACDGFVAINGFPRFTEAPDFPDATPRRVVERMIQRFDQDAEAVLLSFRARCGLDDALPGALRRERLRADLAALRDWDAREALAASEAPLLALGGALDPIVPRQAFPQAALHPGGGHVLPLTEPEWCADHIRRFLRHWEKGG